MGVHKGTNNFKASRNAGVEFIKERIDTYLSRLRKSKAKFDNISQVSDYLCPLLSQDLHAKWIDGGKKGQQPKPVNKATLYRNVEYRAKIDSFIAGSPQRGTDLAAAKNNMHSAQAVISEQRAQISNLKNEISILKKYIENSDIPAEPESDPETSLTTHSYREFTQTARAFSLLLEATDGQFAISNGCLIATYKMVNNTVVNKETLKPYVTWLNKQGGNNE